MSMIHQGKSTQLTQPKAPLEWDGSVFEFLENFGDDGLNFMVYSDAETGREWARL